MLIKEEFLGQHHTADSDAYNTGCILHKLCCTEGLEPKFDFLNITLQEEEKRKKEEAKKSKEYQNSFASFMPPELLKQLGYISDSENDDEESIEDDDYFYNYKDKLIKTPRKENKIEPKSPEETICVKYQIPIESFNNFAAKIKMTSTMEVVA